MDIPSRFSKNTRTIAILLLTLTSGLVLTSGLLASVSAAKTSGTATFANYELAGNPFVVGNSVGTICPNTVGTCTNTEGEPAIRADPSGNFYGSSENVFCVVDRQCGGTFAWKSTDNGNHFTTLPLPNSVSTGSNGFSPAGGDTDIAVAPVRNNNGLYNIYVASLATAPPLANVYVSTSHDGGASWVLNPTGATIPVDDREWIAADGANKACVSYHAFATTNNIFVTCSYDGGTTFTQVANAFDPSHAFNALYNNEIGNLAIDPNNHLIYQSFSSIANAGEETCLNCNTHVVWIAVSIDGGHSFTDYQVYDNPDVTVGYGHQFVNVSVDQAGNVYLVYNDNHNMFYSFSTTFGQSWKGPFQINTSPSNTAIMPWSSAGPAGTLDVVWYGSSYYDGINPPDNYPMTARWQVYFAQNLAATTPNSKWSQTTATGTIHYGGVCESGVTCTGNRDLLDDFGVAASPTTGFAAIIYTSDQYVNSANEPAQPFGSGGGCTQSSTNSFECSHTDIAVQTGGTGLLSTNHHFQITKTDFEQISNNPSLTVQVSNIGNEAINALTAQISSLPLNLPWTPAPALQPGQTTTATTGTLPAMLLLAVGNIYTITITATLKDGTTETQTVSAIYTLGAGIGL
jgi:hypothetical protein